MLHFLHSTHALSFYIGVVLTLSTKTHHNGWENYEHRMPEVTHIVQYLAPLFMVLAQVEYYRHWHVLARKRIITWQTINDLLIEIEKMPGIEIPTLNKTAYASYHIETWRLIYVWQKWATTGSDNGWSHVWCQGIAYDGLLSIEHLEHMSLKFQPKFFQTHLKMSPA